MPLFGGVAKVKVGDTIYLFDRLYGDIYLMKRLPFDSTLCTYFNGQWRCGHTVIPSGATGRQGEYYSLVPLIDTDLNYVLSSVPSSEITVVAVHSQSYDPSVYSVAIEPGYIYAFIWENLDLDETFYITCYSSTSPYPTSVLYTQGPTVFFAYYYKIEGYDNGGTDNCNYVYAEVLTRHDRNHAPSLLKISNVSYITPIGIALFAGGRGILPGTRKDFLTVMVDLTSVSL